MQAVYCGRKVFLKGFDVDQEDEKKAFLNEVEFFFKNQFINLINFIGVYTVTYPAVYIVYEYYTTATLGDFIRTKKWSEMKTEEVLMLTLQIISCIQYLNNNGFIFTCIDPDNILILKSFTAERSTEIKICGFSNIIRYDSSYSSIQINSEHLENINLVKYFCPETIKESKINFSSIVYSKTLYLSPLYDQNFSKLRSGGLDNGYKFF